MPEHRTFSPKVSRSSRCSHVRPTLSSQGCRLEPFLPAELVNQEARSPWTTLDQLGQPNGSDIRNCHVSPRKKIALTWFVTMPRFAYRHFTELKTGGRVAADQLDAAVCSYLLPSHATTVSVADQSRLPGLANLRFTSVTGVFGWRLAVPRWVDRLPPPLTSSV